jgi:hypothetical protein
MKARAASPNSFGELGDLSAVKRELAVVIGIAWFPEYVKEVPLSSRMLLADAERVLEQLRGVEEARVIVACDGVIQCSQPAVIK